MVCVCYPCSWVIHHAVYWVSCAPLKWLRFARVLSELILHGQSKEADFDRLRVKIHVWRMLLWNDLHHLIMLLVESLRFCWTFTEAKMINKLYFLKVICLYASNTLTLHIFDWLFIYQNLLPFFSFLIYSYS